MKRLLFVIGIFGVAALAQSCKHDGPPSPDVWAVVNNHEIKKDEVEKVFRANTTSENPTPSQEEALSLKVERAR